ncbi:hypothetical protein LAC03_24220 [Levilactobacillus acidifarinae]|nr:hypothetical protein LAC03_24220 [Levilactobacillus acidifarinae]
MKNKLAGFAVAVVEGTHYERTSINGLLVYTARWPRWVTGVHAAPVYGSLTDARERCMRVNRDAAHRYSIICIWR